VLRHNPRTFHDLPYLILIASRCTRRTSTLLLSRIAIPGTSNLQSVDERSCSCEAIPLYECAKSLGRRKHVDWLCFNCTYPPLHMRVMKGIPAERPLLASPFEHDPKRTAATPFCVQSHTTHLCLWHSCCGSCEFCQIAPSWTRQSPNLRFKNNIDQRSNP
jgi:hypothetical protein